MCVFIYYEDGINLRRDLVIDNDHISRMERGLRDAIEKGLDKEGHKNATVKCFPTYVRELPSGYEVYILKSVKEYLLMTNSNDR